MAFQLGLENSVWYMYCALYIRILGFLPSDYIMGILIFYCRMIDCAFIIYASDDAFFYSKGRHDVKGDVRMDGIGVVVSCGFGFRIFV